MSLKDNEVLLVKSRSGVVEFNVGIIINETERSTPFSIFRIKWLNGFMASMLCKVARKNIGTFYFPSFSVLLFL